MKTIKTYRLPGYFMLGLIIWALPLSAKAQNGGFAGASTRIGFNARGMAMGNALSAVTSQGSYAYYNPAQAALVYSFKPLDITVGALKFDRVFQTTGIQLPLPPTAGLSFGIMRTGVNDIDGRTDSGYPTELFDLSEYQLATAFGIRLSDKLNFGIGLKFGLANYNKELDQATSLGIDFGMLYSLTDHINVAFTVKDLFANYSWESSDLYNLDQANSTVNTFPTRFAWGVAYQADAFTLSGDFEIQSYNSQRLDTELILPDGKPSIVNITESIQTHAKQLRFGASWDAHERITVRAGWQLPDISESSSRSISSGFSIHLPFDIFSPSIDYAFVSEPYQVADMHIFTLHLNL